MESFQVSSRDLRGLIAILTKQALLLEGEGALAAAQGLKRRAIILEALVEHASEC
ncbi:MAG: hypothetical protein AAFX94_18840 [Myxococcota bacterium]